MAASSLADAGHWPLHWGSSSLLVEAFAQQLGKATGPATDTYFYDPYGRGNYK